MIESVEQNVNYTLVYGMRLFRESGDTDLRVSSPEVELAGQKAGTIAQHTIQGTKEEIKERLMQSVDAFFEIHGL